MAEVLFEPLESRQMVDVAAADEAAVFNDALLEAAVLYLRLVRAQTGARIHAEAAENAEHLAKITGDFAAAGEGLRADFLRATAAVAERKSNLLQAQEAIEVASAELVRALHLAPTTRLVVSDDRPLPIELISESNSLDGLIAQGIAVRPEVGRDEARREATWTRSQQECWRPWLPHLYAGLSSGGFGGNNNADVKNFSDRTDFDIAAIWELDNFGFGNAARQRRWESRHFQAHLAAEVTRDTIAAEIRQAYHRVKSRRQQIEVVQPRIEASTKALELNFQGIRGGELRPIEAQQAISMLADARLDHLEAILAYNIAQLELLRAIGQPLAVSD